MVRPLPKHLDEAAACGALAPEKDVDGITQGSLFGVFANRPIGFPPCTADACIRILDHYGVDLSGKKAVVIGRSMVIGRPVAMLLMRKNATVTICHTRTKDMAGIARRAEVLVVAAGRRGVVTRDFFAPGQTVIDVGIHVNDEGKMCGDVDWEAAEGLADAMTPVPGGVGTVTTAVLLSHVVDAAQKKTQAGK